MGLLMVSQIRYRHLVNQYLRGRKSIARLIGMVALLLLFVAEPRSHRYAIGAGALIFALSAPVGWLLGRWRGARR
jgi:phosphatidylserine synthase